MGVKIHAIGIRSARGCNKFQVGEKFKLTEVQVMEIPLYFISLLVTSKQILIEMKRKFNTMPLCCSSC